MNPLEIFTAWRQVEEERIALARFRQYIQKQYKTRPVNLLLKWIDQRSSYLQLLQSQYVDRLLTCWDWSDR